MLGTWMTLGWRSFAEVLRRPADVGALVALSANNLASVGRLLAAAVALHDLEGVAAGYGAGRLLGRDERTSRTFAIEVGLQRSGLGVALAVEYFPAAAALPRGAVPRPAQPLRVATRLPGNRERP